MVRRACSGATVRTPFLGVSLAGEDRNLVIGGGKASFVALHFAVDGMSVKLVNEGFSGEADGVQVKREEWDRFVADCFELEKHRTGSAALRSGSDQFWFRVRARDSAGHMALESRLTSSNGRSEVRISFNLDPTSLPRVAKGIGELSWRGRS